MAENGNNGNENENKGCENVQHSLFSYYFSIFLSFSLNYNFNEKNLQLDTVLIGNKRNEVVSNSMRQPLFVKGIMKSFLY